MDIPQLHSKSIPQIAWFLQNKNEIKNSKRPIDKMTTAEIGKMYRNSTFLCDTCGKQLDMCNFTLEEHILHLINPMILWSCEDCLIDDMKKGRIIASTTEISEQWKHGFR